MGPGFRRDGDYDFFTASAVFQSHTPGAAAPDACFRGHDEEAQGAKR
jgi:hypothetical protein